MGNGPISEESPSSDENIILKTKRQNAPKCPLLNLALLLSLFLPTKAQLRDSPLKNLNTILPELCNLLNIQPRQTVRHIPALGALTRQCACCHGKSHIFGTIDQLKDCHGGLGLRFTLGGSGLAALLDGEVFDFLAGLDAQDSCVATWTLCVAFAEGSEEFREHGVWCLGLLVSLFEA